MDAIRLEAGRKIGLCGWPVSAPRLMKVDGSRAMIYMVLQLTGNHSPKTLPGLAKQTPQAQPF